MEKITTEYVEYTAEEILDLIINLDAECARLAQAKADISKNLKELVEHRSFLINVLKEEFSSNAN